jgi:hypothetical protein
VFCSARGRRGGCGRTFSIFFADVLPRHGVTAALLARLLASLLADAAVKSAAEALRTPFALETFHRLLRRLRRRLDVVRACLCRRQPPPPSAQTDPLRHSAEHLRAVFPAGSGAADGVAAFQLHFQRPFLG